MKEKRSGGVCCPSSWTFVFAAIKVQTPIKKDINKSGKMLKMPFLFFILNLSSHAEFKNVNLSILEWYVEVENIQYSMFTLAGNVFHCDNSGVLYVVLCVYYACQLGTRC